MANGDVSWVQCSSAAKKPPSRRSIPLLGNEQTVVQGNECPGARTWEEWRAAGFEDPRHHQSLSNVGN